MRSYLVFSCLLVAAAIAGCGGGGGSTGSPLPANGGTGAPTTLGQAQFTLTIPAQTSAAAAARRAAFISPNAQSIAIAVATGTASPPPAQPVNLNASSPNCTTGASGLTCTIAVSAPIGTDTFAVTLYGGQNGSGSVLSTARVSGVVNAAQSNTIAIALNGVVASIAVSITNGNNLIPGGYATALPVVITAKDASGATIVGADPYASPITLTNADTSGVTTLSTTTVSAPSTAVTLNYAPSDANGGVLAVSGLPIGATQIGASASGVAPANVSAGTFQYIADRFAGYGLNRTLTGTGSVTITTYNGMGTPSPNPSTFAYTVSTAHTVHSGATFNGIATSDTRNTTTFTQTSPSTAAAPEVVTLDSYRANALTATGSIFQQFGETTNDVNADGFTSPITGNVNGTVVITSTYPTNGTWQDDVLPHVATNWANSLVPFTQVYSNAEVATFQLNADGSTSFNETTPSTIALTQTAAGAGTNLNNGVTTTIGLPVAATPPATGNRIPVAQETTSPAPGPTSTFAAADWYPGAAAPAQPLYAFTYTEALVAIPGACSVPSSIATQAWAIVNSQTAIRVPNFQYRVRTQSDYYVPGGIGWVCRTYTETQTNYRFTTGVISTQTQITYAYGVASAGALGLVRRP